MKICGTKALCIATLSVILVLLTSCTALLVSDVNNPRLAWEQFSEYISDGDFSAAFEMTENSNISPLSDSDSEYINLLLDGMSKSYKYEFVSDTDVFGVTAWQTVAITALDMRILAENAVVGSVEEAKAYAYKNGSYKDDAEITAAVNKKITELLVSSSDCLSTTVVRVEFSYSDGKWKPVMSDTLYDVLSGYASYTDEAISECLKKLN